MFARRANPQAIPKTPLTSLVGEGVELKGDIRFSGGLRVDGRVQGQVLGRPAEDRSAALLVLSGKGHIEGGVRCSHAVIDGTIDGDLDVEQVLELQSNARITGTIRYRQLRMDVGATVHGRMVRVEDATEAEAEAEARPDRAGGPVLASA